MNNRKSLLCIVVLLLLGAMAPEARAQSQNGAGPDMQDMMKKMMVFTSPGEAHKKLEPLIGNWNVVMRAWMEPGKPPMESKATEQSKWVLGGRFVMEELSGQMMGMPFNGMGLTGYDNFKKKYVTSWADDTETAMYISQGDFDASGKILTTTGTMDEPVTGERDKPVKYVCHIIDNNKHVMEIYDYAGTPKEVKVVEITYTRQ